MLVGRVIDDQVIAEGSSINEGLRILLEHLHDLHPPLSQASY
jgi:hypothetical protein